MSSPTSRSLAYLRENEYRAFKVEHWNSFAHIRQDFAGFADILAFKKDTPGVLAIQTTSMDNVSARLKKISENEHVEEWKAAGNRVVVHGWAKRGPRGKRKVYQLKEVHIG